MKEKTPKRFKEGLVADFDRFLRSYLGAGDFDKAIEFATRPESLQKAAELRARGLSPDNAGLLTDEEIREVFNYLGTDYGFFTNLVDEKVILGQLLEGGVRNTRTLSVGCGVAPHEIFLSSRGIITKPIVCVDFAQSTLERARSIAERVGVDNLSFLEKSALEIDFEREFGQVWLIDSLHWIRRWQECLERSIKALEKNGTLFLCWARFSKRVEISPRDLVPALQHRDMSVQAMRQYNVTHSRSPRVILSAKKTA